MKLTSILILLPALAIATPIPEAILPDCKPEDLNYATYEDYFRTAELFCNETFRGVHNNAYRVDVGYTRRFYDIETFHSTSAKKKTRAYSIEIGMLDNRHEAQHISIQGCLNGFTLLYPNTQRHEPCYKSVYKDKVEIIKDWRWNKHIEGYGDVWFEVWPGYTI